jgi:tRNA 2-thiocytidine biosynthesis protein TtcA
VIRPLAYCAEKDIAAYARQMNFPIIPCDLCGSQENLQRQKVKDMLQGWELEQPGRINNIFRAITNVEPSHLADTDLYDFKNLSQANAEDEDPLFGDIDEKEKSEGALTLANSEGSKIEFIRNE